MKIPASILPLGIIVTVSILLVFTPAFGQSQDKIPYKQLSWSDFKGVVGTFSDDYTGPKKDFDALTSWGFNANWKFKKTDSSFCEYKLIIVNSVASFQPFGSWVKEESKTDFVLLKHEQGHLDIAEIHARVFESELSGKRFSCPNGVYNADRIKQVTKQVFQEYLTDTEEMQQLYDTETNHYFNKQEQADWNKKIGCMLQNNGPSSYCLSLKASTQQKTQEKVPGWIKNNAKWWAEGQIGDSDFVSGIQYMIKEKIMVIPDLPKDTQMELKDEKRAMGMEREQNVPDWVRNNAGWWADGLISEDDFLNGIKYLVEKGIIRI